MIIVPKPIPKRAIVVGGYPIPDGYSVVHAEDRPFRADAYYFDNIGAGFRGRCTCTAKAWFMSFYVKCVMPDTPIILVERAGDFLDWVKEANPNWPVFSDTRYSALDPAIGDRLNTPVGV